MFTLLCYKYNDQSIDLKKVVDKENNSLSHDLVYLDVVAKCKNHYAYS